MATATRLGPAVPPELPRDYTQRSGRFHDWECAACKTLNAVYLVVCRACFAEGRIACRWAGCGRTTARAELVIHMSAEHSRPQADQQRFERSDAKQFFCCWEDERSGEVCRRTFVKEAELESHFAAHSHAPGLFCPVCPPYYFLNEEDHRRNHLAACDPWFVQGPRPIHRRRHRSQSTSTAGSTPRSSSSPRTARAQQLHQPTQQRHLQQQAFPVPPPPHLTQQQQQQQHVRPHPASAPPTTSAQQYEQYLPHLLGRITVDMPSAYVHQALLSHSPATSSVSPSSPLDPAVLRSSSRGGSAFDDPKRYRYYSDSLPDGAPFGQHGFTGPRSLSDADFTATTAGGAPAWTHAIEATEGVYNGALLQKPSRSNDFGACDSSIGTAGTTGATSEHDKSVIGRSLLAASGAMQPPSLPSFALPVPGRMLPPLHRLPYRGGDDGTAFDYFSADPHGQRGGGSADAPVQDARALYTWPVDDLARAAPAASSPSHEPSPPVTDIVPKRRFAASDPHHAAQLLLSMRRVEREADREGAGAGAAEASTSNNTPLFALFTAQVKDAEVDGADGAVARGQRRKLE